MPRTMPTPIEDESKTRHQGANLRIGGLYLLVAPLHLDLGHGPHLGAQGGHELGPGQIERRVPEDVFQRANCPRLTREADP